MKTKVLIPKETYEDILKHWDKLFNEMQHQTTIMNNQAIVNNNVTNAKLELIMLQLKVMQEEKKK